MNPTFASLYSGCGGFDLGFIQAGFRSAGAFDIDHLAIKVHQSNLKSPATVCDLTSNPTALAALKVDVLLAGPPCQGFSTIGKRDVSDPRNSLLVLAGRLASSIRPKVFVAENVAGVVAGEHKRYWTSLRGILQAAGYRAAEICCNAHQMGVPQQRRRMVMIAWQEDRDIEITFQTTAGGIVAAAIKSVRGLPNHNPVRLRPKSSSGLIASHIGQGQKLSNVRAGKRAIHTWQIPEVFGRTSAQERLVLEILVKLRRQKRVRSFGDADPVSARVLGRTLGFAVRDTLDALIRKGYVRRLETFYDLTHTFNGRYRRLDSTEPSPTVDTKFGDPRYFLHPTSNRGLTVREAARLQGFPDDFVFEGPKRQQFRLVGNAVPPPMANQIAVYIRDVLLKAPRT